VFERFTTQARQAMTRAIEEARALGHAAIGTEHILLGLLHEEQGVPARALGALGIDFTAARNVVTRTLGGAEVPAIGQLPFTPAAQRALERALPEAIRRGGADVEPEHVLLALVSDPTAGATAVLLALGPALEDIRRELDSIVGPAPAPAPSPAPGRHDPPPGHEYLAASGELEVGWRGRAIALAALGAAVLARSAFDLRRIAPLAPLEMQVLAHLALGLDSDPASPYPGEEAESLMAALACDYGDLRHALDALLREQLVVAEEEDRVAITPAGVGRVQQWLGRIVSLFGGWPPEHPDVDDATG
jgi:hypothetical protein